ncbi:response regulator [Kamptonema formosum]|uniref:response regulator n=1 Tax=Kamptonema formosum TaxID=331992 RepID=UPI00034D4127|nr:response regulator [Oscillatoria sp. PCC 10802]
MKILLVEDDKSMRAALAQLLAAHDCQIALASDGQTGLELATAIEYDLILLDWQIPQLDGISLCRKLRSQGYTKPILLLTAKNSNADIVAGLDAGADDYVIKPYNPEALAAKIRALLRRSGALTSQTLCWGELCLDSTSAKVTCGGEVISLTATEYNLLELFLQNPNRIFSRSKILDRLWGFDDAPTENAVTTHIKDLRKKLKAGGLLEEIIETVYGMGYRLKPAPNRPASTSELGAKKSRDSQKNPAPKDMTAISRVLDRFRNSLAEQIEVLERSKTALLEGNFTNELQLEAEREAHKLAGSMGTFGYPEGSTLAREAEHLLMGARPLKGDEISQFCQLVLALQQEFAKSPEAWPPQPVPAIQTRRVLAINDDPKLAERLLSEADAWGIRIKIAADLATARSRIALAAPDAILLDLSFSETEEDGLTLLRELTEGEPHIPVVALAGRDSLAKRLAVSRLGAKQFLGKPATVREIFQALDRVLAQPKTSEAKVLLVDDDPAIGAALSALLTPWGLEVTALTEPQQFWEVLTATSPDLVVLDLEMPPVSGIELCQVVRQDTHWGNIPILVVTAHTDAESLQQAFAAGADDFIAKPVLGPELVTRILSRIERVRWHSRRGGIPQATGE